MRGRESCRVEPRSIGSSSILISGPLGDASTIRARQTGCAAIGLLLARYRRAKCILSAEDFHRRGHIKQRSAASPKLLRCAQKFRK